MKYIRTAALALAMLTPLAASAAQKIAVVNYEMAVFESDAMKQYNKKMDAEYAPKIKKLKALQESIQTLEQKLQKDGPTMTNSQRENTQLEIKRKYEDLQLQDRQLRTEKARSDQAELEKLKPRLEKAIDQVQADMKYDFIFDRRGAVRVGNAEYDITRKVIERLNKMK